MSSPDGPIERQFDEDERYDAICEQHEIDANEADLARKDLEDRTWANAKAYANMFDCFLMRIGGGQ